jgi:hypothetical protein
MRPAGRPSGSTSEAPRGLARALVPLAALVLLASCASARAFVRVGGAVVEVIDPDPQRLRQLEETFRALEGLEARPPVIAAEDYRAGTSFVSLYGFEFDGGALARWWAARVRRLEFGDPWTVAVHDGDDRMTLRDDFFSLSLVERLAVLVHEARHADPGAHRHVDCPPGFGLAGRPACDASPIGAYGFQAALLFELYARGLLDPADAHREWRRARQRIR